MFDPNIIRKDVESGSSSFNERIKAHLDEADIPYSSIKGDIVKEVLKDVKSTILLKVMFDPLFDNWECSQVRKFVDDIINTVTSKYATEVVNKEKEIEEIAKFILANRTGKDSEQIADGLYDMGYRKVAEVRKGGVDENN